VGPETAAAFSLAFSQVRFEIQSLNLVPLQSDLQQCRSICDIEVTGWHPSIGSPEKVLGFTMVETEPAVICRVMVPQLIGRKPNVFETGGEVLPCIDWSILVASWSRDETHAVDICYHKGLIEHCG